MQCDTLKKKILNSKTFWRLVVNDIVPVVKKYSNKEKKQNVKEWMEM